MLERAMAHPQIEFLLNTVVEEVLGVEEKDAAESLFIGLA
jgi:thioredoxin reductase (NADPH)